jgi:hypothetical protein
VGIDLKKIVVNNIKDYQIKIYYNTIKIRERKDD